MENISKIKEILKNYNDVIMQCNLLKINIKHYEELLKLSDLSGFDYYKEKTFLGIKYLSPIFSSVENEAFKKEKIHKLNYDTIFELKIQEQKKLLNLKKKINMINSAIARLQEQDRFIIQCKFIDNRKLTYQDIVCNFYDKYKFYLDIRTIKRRVKEAIKKIENNLNNVGIDLNNTIKFSLLF